MLLDDAIRDGQAEARSFADWFGGEERVEDLGQLFGWDALAVIADLDDDSVTVPVRSNPNVAFAFDGLVPSHTRQGR